MFLYLCTRIINELSKKSIFTLKQEKKNWKKANRRFTSRLNNFELRSKNEEPKELRLADFSKITFYIPITIKNFLIKVPLNS